MASLSDDCISTSTRHLAVDEERELEDLGVGDGAGEVGGVEDGDEVAVLVLVLEGDVVLGRQLAAVHPLHHQDQLVVGQVIVVDRNPEGPYSMEKTYWFEFDKRNG